MKTLTKAFVVIALSVLVLPVIASAQTVSGSSLQAQIAALEAELAVLQQQLASQGGGSSWCYNFSTNLSIGMSGADVTALQTALQKDGESVSVTGTFDDQTASAVTGFQEKYASVILAPSGLQYGTGYVGKGTRAELNSMFGCGGSPIPPPVLNVNVVSPTAGQSFVVGSTMTIQWTPANAGVAAIQLVPANGGGAFGVYGLKVFGYPVNYNGSYTFSIPSGVPAGSYYVELFNPEPYAGSNQGPGTVIGKSGLITITSSSVTPVPSPSLSIESVSGLQSAYQPGQPVSFTINGLQLPSSQPADSGDGFNVQAYISTLAPTQTTMTGENGSFNSATGLWSVTLIAPSNVGTYNLSVALYCGNSPCSAQYPNGSSQVSQNFNLVVSANAPTSTVGPLPTVTFTANPTMITAGQQTTLSWTSTNATYCTATGGSPSADHTNWAGTGSTSQTVIQEPSVSTSYVITCTGPGGTSNPSVVYVTVTPSTIPAVTVISPASAANLTQGTTQTIQWTTAATGVPTDVGLNLMQNGTPVQGIGNVPNTGSYSWVVPGGYSGNGFQIRIYGQGGYGDSPMFNIVPGQVPTPTAQVSISPNVFNFSIAQGQFAGAYPSSLATFSVSPNEPVMWSWASAPIPSWLSVAAQSFAASNGTTLGVSLGTAAANLQQGTYSGTVTISPAPGASVTFIPQTITVNLTVLPANSVPTASISASPTTITLGQSTTVTWSSNYASACTPSNAFGTGTMGSSGSFPETPTAPGVYTYTVTCAGSGGTSKPASVTVTVNPGQAPLASLTLTAPIAGATWQPGKTYPITWTSTGFTASTPLQIIVYDTRYGPSDDVFDLGSPITTVGAGNYSVTVPSNAPAGNTYAVQIHDVTSPLGIVTTQASPISVAIPTQTAPALSVSLDPNSPPAGTLVMGSTGNNLAAFHLSAAGDSENVRIAQLTVMAQTASVSANFTNLSLWNGSTELASAAQPVKVSGGYSYLFAVNPSSIVVPQGGFLMLTLKGDLIPYGAAGAPDDQTYAFQLSSSGVTAFGATSNLPATVTGSALGSNQTALRSTMVLSAAGVGGSQHTKSSVDTFGTVTFTANAAGPVSLNTLKVSFSGNAVASNPAAFINSVQLVDMNGNIIPGGSGSAFSNGGGSVTWTFPGGFPIPSGSSYALTVRGNSTLIPPISNVTEGLGVSVQSVADVTYADGIDASAKSGLELSQQTFPLTVNSITYPTGQ